MQIYLKNKLNNELVTDEITDQQVNSFSKITAELNAPYYDAFFLNSAKKMVPYKLSPINFVKLMFFSHRYQRYLSNGKTLRPYATRQRTLAYVYLTNNGMNKQLYRRQAVAYLLGNLANLVLPFNRPQLSYEKLSERAQESSYAYFKYVQENYPNEKIYFVIKQASSDFNKVKEMKNIVLHGSFKHFYLLIRAKLFVSSETPAHAYFWRENMGLTANVVRTKPYVFLQHGVLGFKKLDLSFYENPLTAPAAIITSSQVEQDIVISQLGYTPERAPITGLARWDMLDLTQERVDERDKILLFYTWRPWLDDINGAEFINSDYFKHLRDVVAELNETVTDKEIVVMLHPKIHGLLNKNELARVTLWTDNDGPLNELMSSVTTLITDYSSLAWEAYYREIPVVFDMFDQQRYEAEVGSYLDLADVPFGIKVNASVTNALTIIRTNNYKLTTTELEQKTYYFTYTDQKNSERIHQVVAKLDLKANKKAKRQAFRRALLRVIK